MRCIKSSLFVYLLFRDFHKVKKNAKFQDTKIPIVLTTGASNDCELENHKN